MTLDDYFLGLARYVSVMSSDPSTRCGAVIVRPGNIVVSTGYNDFARGVKSPPQRWEDRTEKLGYVVHAEMRAIVSARQSLVGCTLYVWPMPTCDRCAMHIIEVGIVRVVAQQATLDQKKRWRDSFARAETAFAEAGVELILG
jgi:dCMP deaminase